MAFSYQYNLYDLIDEYSIPDEDSKFGCSVDIDNLYIAVGCSKHDVLSHSENGCVYLFNQDGLNNWSFHSIITPSAPEANLYFGSKVAISGDSLAVLASGGADEGKIYLFNKTSSGGTDTWSEVDSYLFEDANSISLQSNYLIIGAGAYNSTRGRAVVLRIDTNEYDEKYFTEVSVITNSNSVIGDYFGQSVSISENYAIVSSPEEKDMGTIYIYGKNYNGDDSWGLIQKLIPYGISLQDNFGISLSNTDDYIIVGAKNRTSDDSQPLAGAIYLIKNNNNVWYFLNEYNIHSLETFDGALFGSSAAISSDYIVSGAPYASTTGIIEILSKDRNWGFLSSFSNANSSRLGSDVAIYGETIIASEADYSNNTNGDVYIYFNSPSHLRLGQEFPVNSEFVPSKTSVYLKRVGSNTDNVWRFSSTEELSIDATNFSKLTQKDNKITFEDSSSGYSGNGYMICSPDDLLTVIGDYSWAPPTSFYYYGYGYGRTAGEYGYTYVPSSTLGRFYLDHPRTGTDVIGYNPLGAYLFYDEPNGRWVVNDSLTIDNSEGVLYYWVSNSGIASNSISGTLTDSAKYTNDRGGGNFYIISKSDFPGTELSDTFGTLQYPIQTSEPGVYYLHIRYLTKSGKNSLIYPQIDDAIMGKIYKANLDVSDSWDWATFKIVIPDDNMHYINVKLGYPFSAIDKIVINTSIDSPIGYGPDLSDSPYITTHLRIFNSTSSLDNGIYYSSPNEPLFIYDYKTTLEEITRDDWYNFNINILDSRLGFTNPSDFPDTYFIVICTTGSNNKNYLVWETEDSDEYTATYCSSIRV